MRFSRTRLTDVLHRRHSASRAPRPIGTRRDDGSVEVNQSLAVRPGVEKLPAIPPGALMAVCDQQRQAAICMVDDLVELDRRVAVAEVARPATQEPVEVFHDLLDRPAQTVPRGELSHTLAGALHRLPRGPAGEEADVPESRVPGAHPAVMEAQEVQALTTFGQ